MKRLFILLVFSIALSHMSHAQEHKQAQPAKVGVNYGQSVENKQAITVKKLENNLSTSNNFSGKVTGKVAQVCKMSGCYLTLQSEEGNNPIMVHFADDYTVPADLIGKTAVVQGTATARNKENKDTKKTQKAITMIADGVLVVK